MKKFLIMLLFIVFMVQPCIAAISPSMDNRRTYKNSYRWTGRSRDYILQWAQAVEDALDGTSGVDSLLLSGLSTSAGAALTDEGILFYDTGTDNLKYRNASSLVTLATSTSGTMDETYNQGSGITVDTGTVALTGTDALNAEVLAIVHAETGAYPAFSISNAGTDPTIEITTSGTGADITGTSAKWSISKTGVLTLENGDAISNGTNDVFLFDTGVEDLTIDCTTGTNTITLGANGSGAVTWDFGTFVTVQGISTLTGSTAGDFTIQVTSDTGNEDLIINQAGSGDYSVIINSAGTGAAAIDLTTATGGILLSAKDDIILTCASTTTDDNITIQQTGAFAAGVDILAAGTGTDAILLSASAGGITLTATGAASGDVVITTVDDFSLVATDDITIDGNSAGSIITIGGNNDGNVILIGVDDSAADAITIGSVKDTIIIDGIAVTVGDTTAAAATIIQSGTGDLALTSTDDITLTVATTTSDAIVLTNTAGTNVTEDSMAIEIRATAGGINIQSDAAINGDTLVLRVDGGATADIMIHNDAGTGTDCINLVADEGGITLDGNQEASSWTLTANGAGDDLSLIQDGAADGSIVLTSAGTAANAIDINTSAGGIDIDMAGGIAGEDFSIVTATSIDFQPSEAVAGQFKVTAGGTHAGDVIELESTDGGIMLDANGAANGDVGLNAANDVILTAGGDLTLAVTDTFNMAGALIANNRITTVVDIDNRTLTEAESGSIIVFTMTGAAATCTLPEATANNIGMWFILIDANVTGARDLTIDPEGAGSINGAAGGNFIKNETDNLGEGVYIFSTGADVWYTGLFGHTTVWTVE